MYIILLLIIAILISVLFVQIIWNMVIPDIFGLKEISYWQTLGLLILANIFFGGHCNASNMNSYTMM